MKQYQPHPDIYQLRIGLRGISPLIWRRLLVRSDTTLAQLHLMLQILFDWGNEHLHHFHIFGKDYGSDGADTRHVTLNTFGFQQGERFWYVYNYYAQWQCDIRLESTLPCDPKRFYPVCTGGQRPAPPEHVQDAQTYLALLDEHRYPSWDALRVLADAGQVVLEAPADVSIREAIGDLDAIREAMDRLDLYQQLQPSAFHRRHLNAQSLLLDSGVLGSRVVPEAQLLLKAIEKEGLQGGEHDKSPVVHPRHIHDPGIQQERLEIFKATHEGINAAQDDLPAQAMVPG